MIEFRPPEPIVLLLQDMSGNYSAITSVTVEAKRLLPGRDSLRGDEPVAFTFTVETRAPGADWLGGWKAEADTAGKALGNYIAHALLIFPDGEEKSPCPFRIVAA